MLVNLFQRLFHRRYHQHQRFAFFSPFNCCCDIEKNEYDLNKIVVTWYSLENIVVVNMEDIDAECHYLVRNVWETLYWKTSVLPFAQVAASVLALSSLTIDDTHKTKPNILRDLQYTITQYKEHSNRYHTQYKNTKIKDTRHSCVRCRALSCLSAVTFTTPDCPSLSTCLLFLLQSSSCQPSSVFVKCFNSISSSPDPPCPLACTSFYKTFLFRLLLLL